MCGDKEADVLSLDWLSCDDTAEDDEQTSFEEVIEGDD